MTHKLTNGRARRGRKTVTYIDNLKEDSGLVKINEMRTMCLTEMERELEISI